MRNLTIKRTKSFVACLAKMKVYIEDPTANDLTINGVPCRKLGTLKNGEEKTFQIDTVCARVFVIADRLSKGFCNEYYELPAGEEDILLTGKNRYNLATGNAFRFDGVTDEGVLQNRKNGTRTGIIVLCIAAAVGFVIGLINSGLLFPSLTAPKEEVFSAEGMQITLTDEFITVPADGYTACYSTEDEAVLVLKEEFTLLEGLEELTAQEYAELIIEGGSLSATELQTMGDMIYFEYEGTNTETNDTFAFLATVFKTEDAFWLIQFSPAENSMEDYRQTFLDYTKTITFTES